MAIRPRHGRALGLVALVTSTVVAVGCGAAEDGPVVADGAAVDRGEELYVEFCAACHGVDLRGTDRGPSHLSIVYAPDHHSDDSFRSAIARGAPQHHWDFGDMAPVEGLSADDVEAVISFVRAEQRRQGFER